MNRKNLFFTLILMTYLFYSKTTFTSLAEQYFSLDSNLKNLSKISINEKAEPTDGSKQKAEPTPKERAKPEPTPTPTHLVKNIDITLRNINLESPNANNKEAFIKGLEKFSTTADARNNASVIAKIKADVIEILTIDKNLIDQAEKILENIGFTPAQIDKEISSFKKTKIKPVQPPASAEEIKIKMFAHIKTQLDKLKAMDVGTPTKKEVQRDKANEYINVVEEYVLQNKAGLITDNDKINTIEATTKEILSITPLTISTVIKTLAHAGFDQPYIYKLITDTYNQQIKFIKSETGLGSRNISKKGELPHKGPCDDISDALSYGVAISSELIPLKTKLDVEGRLSKTDNNFLKEVTALQNDLDTFLNSSDNIKQAFRHCTGLSVAEYLKMIEIKRPVFCRRDFSEFKKFQMEECTPYISFYGLLESIDNLMDTYTKGKKLSKIQKTNILQKIINQLNNFIYYNTPSKNVNICSSCLMRDIFRWVKGQQHHEDLEGTYGGTPPIPKAHPNYENDLDIQFKKITDFFENLPAKEKNSSTQSGIIAAQHIRKMLKKSFDDERDKYHTID